MNSATENQQKQDALPALTYGLQLLPSARNTSGEPAWVLYNPSTFKYFTVGWLEYELIKHWSLGSVQKLVWYINESTTLSIASDDVVNFYNFLKQYNLIDLNPRTASSELYQRYQENRKKRLAKSFRNYLFFRIRLLHPDRFIEATMPIAKLLFTRTFFYIMIFLSILSLYLINRQWSSFVNSFWYFFNFEGMLYPEYFINFYTFDLKNIIIQSSIFIFEEGF